MFEKNLDLRWVGLRYVNLLRCSNLSQADTSPDGQKATNDLFAQALQMKWVDDIYAEGISGSQTFNRKDIEELVRRKRERNDFDVVVVYEFGRLTRGGIRHGNVVIDQLKKAGLTVLSSTEIIPEGPEGDIVIAVKHYANQLQARNISQSAARGLAQSLEDQTRPAASRTPYGLDRLFRNAAGTPTMLVRWEGMTQICFRPNADGGPDIEVARYSRPSRGDRANAKGRRQRFSGYRKQPDETSSLVPGATDRLGIVVEMFTAYDLWRWGYHKIAKELNRREVPSSEGIRWSLSTVRTVLQNPIYLGIEVRHRFTNALYNKLSPRGPVPVSVDQDKLESENRKTVPVVERPRDEWKLVDVPALKDLLPPEVRQLATDRISKLLDPNRKQDPRKGVPIHRGAAATHRHMESPFILTHLLTCEQTGHSMRGEAVKKKSKHGPTVHRYYVDGSAIMYAQGDGAARRVRAEPLETAVMNAVWEVVTNIDEFIERVREQAEAFNHQDADDQSRQALEGERTRVQQRLQAAYKLLGGKTSAGFEEMMLADTERLQSIDRDLDNLSRTGAPQEPAVDFEGVLKRLQKLPKTWDALPHRQLKVLLAAMVENLTLDLQTLELTFTIVVPESLALPHDGNAGAGDAVRLDCTRPWSSEAKANPRIRIKLDEIRCAAERKARATCFTCRRSRPAA